MDNTTFTGDNRADFTIDLYARLRDYNQDSDTFTGTTAQLYGQALRRIRTGKAFMQPSLGLREFVAYFQEGDSENGPPPIPVDMDLGLMVYDIFDLHDYEIRKKARPQLSLYHCVMKQGVIQVPPYDSPEVLKGAGLC